MTIAFFEIEGWEKEYINEALFRHNVVFSDDPLDELHKEIDTSTDVISVFVDSRITKEILDRFPNLAYITTRSTGFNHIDLEECTDRGIVVSNVPAYGSQTVAEYTMGLMLMLSRNIFQAADQLKEIGSFSLDSLRGFDLEGKTLGVVGTGRIGAMVIRMASGFGMKIVAHDPYVNEDIQRKYGVTYLELPELLAKADIITLHCPFTKDTQHLIDEEAISHIKKGAIVINTSRGELIKTEALVKALQDGVVSAAALDVLEAEGEQKDDFEFLSRGQKKEEVLTNMLYNRVLIDMPNVIVTPHNAFNSNEALMRILETTIENITMFEQKNVQNVVNPS